MIKTTMYKSVMIIDDTYVDRYVAERNIKKYNFAEEVIAMDSAISALNYLRNITDSKAIPQLIFLDIRMPEIDGFGFLDEYAKLPEVVRTNSVVLMLSTSLNPSDHEKVKNYKFVAAFLNKPLNESKLNIIPDLRMKSDQLNIYE